MMKENPQADMMLRRAAIDLDLSDSEAVQKEKEYQKEQKSLWNRVMRRIRPNHAQWTRQDALYNIDHNPDLGLPLKAFEAINDPQKTAQTLASEELKAQGVDEKIAQRAQPILEAIGVESYKNYDEYDPNKDEEYFQFYLKKEKKSKAKSLGRKLFPPELIDIEKTARADWSYADPDQKMPFVREQAIENASKAGIAHAPELVAAITGEAKNPQELLAELSLADLIKQVKKNLPAMTADQSFNPDLVKTLLSNIIHDKSNWLDDAEIQIIESIMNKEEIKSHDHDKDVDALMIVGMGIHVSWSAFQGPRSVVDQKELFDQAQEDKEVMMGPDFARRYSNLRVIRPVNRTFAQMQVNKFKEGYGENNDYEKGMSMAIFEILKDLINIGLPENTAA